MASNFGVLDFIPREKEAEVEESFQYTKRLAQYADKLGLKRYWIGEHHNTPSLLSSSPMLILSHLAAVTENIKLGTGGVMLDNLSSYQVAENFKVLQAMFPNRFEAGIGHSSAGEKQTQAQMAIKMVNPSPYEIALVELAALLNDELPASHPYRSLRAMPVLYQKIIPLHVLMTSQQHAKLAGENGWGMVFGLYLQPDMAECRETIRIYREFFRPSPMFAEPQVLVAVYVVSAYNEQMILPLETSLDHWIITFALNKRKVYQLLSTEDASDYPFSTEEREIINQYTDAKIVGTPEQLAYQFANLKAELNCDEFLVVNQLSGFAYRKELIEIIAKIND